MVDKALVIRDDKCRFKDLGDVLAVARAEGGRLFRTHESVHVVRLFFDSEVGWIAVVRCPVKEGCSKTLGVSGGEKRLRNESERKSQAHSCLA